MKNNKLNAAKIKALISLLLKNHWLWRSRFSIRNKIRMKNIMSDTKAGLYTNWLMVVLIPQSLAGQSQISLVIRFT